MVLSRHEHGQADLTPRMTADVTGDGGMRDLGLLPSDSARVMIGTRLSEAIAGLRSVRQLGHPYVDTEWFRDALRWSANEGDVLTTLCAAPEGPPGFLLDCVSAARPWPDELYDLLTMDAPRVQRDLTVAFDDHVPSAVQAAFDDHREGLAAVIRQFDRYVSAVLEPMWLRVSMALSSDVERIKELLGNQLSQTADPSLPVAVPTAFGVRIEAFRRTSASMVSVPVARPETVFATTRLPRAPVATLIGASRATILFALDDAMTARDLARVTGQRKGSLLHHLRVLCQTNLVAEVELKRSSVFRRTPFGDLLIDTDMTAQQRLAGSNG
jgi:hypothetical protein